jgi:hypothetical protein
MPWTALTKEHARAVRSLQSVGWRSLARATKTELDNYHKTASGRILVLTYSGAPGSPAKRIYLDHLGDTLMMAFPPEGLASRVATKHAAKKAAQKSTSVFKVARKSAPGWARDSSGDVLFGKAPSNTPKPVRDFSIHFLINIRKIICPNAKNKAVLGAASTGIVGALALWLVRTFGITSEVAETFASAVLITIATATKGAFCDMTAEMAKAPLRKG